jgi:hypothetical protein
MNKWNIMGRDPWEHAKTGKRTQLQLFLKTRVVSCARKKELNTNNTKQIF